MKRVLLLAAALFMVAGVAWGQVMVLTPGGACEVGDVPNFIIAGDDFVNETDSAGEGSSACLELVDPEELFIDNYYDGLDFSPYSYFNFYAKLVSGEVTTPWNGGAFSDGWDDGFGWYPSPIDYGTGEWVYNSMSLADAEAESWGTIDWTYVPSIGIELGGGGTVRFDHITISVTPEDGMLAEPEPPPPPITITGTGHRLLVGQDIDLAVDAGDIEPTAYQWSKDGEDLEGETGATLSILSVVVDDTGDYSCLVTYEEEGGDAAYAEAEPSYYVWVTETALPLAGGLGLGLIAGACALAGVVSIRRKK